MTGDDHNDALVDLQTRLAFQDHTIAELNEVIADQQRQLDQLQLKLKALNDKLSALEETVDTGRHAEGQEKPPHY